MKRALSLLALSLALTSCGRPPRPVVFGQLDHARATPEGLAAREASPALFAKAEALHKKAEDAFARGDTATAELLGRGALAAYARAAATARLGLANARSSGAATTLARSEERFTADEAARLEVEREVERLEAEVVIRKEALAPVASGKTDAAREAARWVAARANLAVAEATCGGADLLAPKAKGVAEARRLLAEVADKARDGKANAPIDASTRVRALCLKALTQARAVAVNGKGPLGDQLVEELAAAGFAATRDERGVVAVLPIAAPKAAPFEGSKLSAAGKKQLEALGKIAKAHPTWALIVVVHAAPGKLDAGRDAARAKLAIAELAAQGVDAGRIGASTPGATLLAHDPKDPKTHPLNERLELVFVGS